MGRVSTKPYSSGLIVIDIESWLLQVHYTMLATFVYCWKFLLEIRPFWGSSTGTEYRWGTARRSSQERMSLWWECMCQGPEAKPAVLVSRKEGSEETWAGTHGPGKGFYCKYNAHEQGLARSRYVWDTGTPGLASRLHERWKWRGIKDDLTRATEWMVVPLIELGKSEQGIGSFFLCVCFLLFVGSWEFALQWLRTTPYFIAQAPSHSEPNSFHIPKLWP